MPNLFTLACHDALNADTSNRVHGLTWVCPAFAPLVVHGSKLNLTACRSLFLQKQICRPSFCEKHKIVTLSYSRGAPACTCREVSTEQHTVTRRKKNKPLLRTHTKPKHTLMSSLKVARVSTGSTTCRCVLLAFVLAVLSGTSTVGDTIRSAP